MSGTLFCLASPQWETHVVAADDGASPQRQSGGWLTENFERMIMADGGPVRVKAQLERCSSRAAKIEFLKTFQGIGDKYVRNVLANVYHPDLRNRIVCDGGLLSPAT